MGPTTRALPGYSATSGGYPGELIGVDTRGEPWSLHFVGLLMHMSCLLSCSPVQPHVGGC